MTARRLMLTRSALAAGFVMFVPGRRADNPITGTNPEGVFESAPPVPSGP